MSERVNDAELREMAALDDDLPGMIASMARELLAARERIAELERLPVALRQTRRFIERVANVRLVALDRIVADLDRSRAVVEAARWEYDQGLATPHLCRALAAHDRGES